MNETVRLVLSLSVSGSILAAFLFLLKPYMKNRLSKTVQYYIWLLVLLRMVIPFSFDESLLNRVSYNADVSIVSTSPDTANPISLPSAADNVKNGVYNQDTDHQRYLNDLFSQYALLLLWLLGLGIALIIHLTGYFRFWNALKKSNRPALDAETRLLNQSWSGLRQIRLFRNPLINTPMLIGILRPCLVIPDQAYDEKQLRNILLHELTHFRRSDIAFKWLTMIVASIHWFNPLVYFIKKEINHACELACDEAVIRGFNPAERQAYGHTLITIATENKYPAGVLQATMSEEMKTLKERLVSIMKYKPKTKLSLLLSVGLLLAVLGGAVLLGACTGNSTAQKVSNSNSDVLYNNDKYGFSLTLSKDFADAIQINNNEGIICFVDKEIQKTEPQFTFGVVGRIEIYDKNKYTRENLKQNEDIYGLRYLGENDKYYFGWAHATDVQVPSNASEATINNYRSMEEKFDKSIQTFKIKEASQN